MPILTVRLPDTVLNEVNVKANSLHLSKNAYINKAIDMLNKEMNNKAKKEKILKASYKVRANSMEINSQFSIIEDDAEV